MGYPLLILGILFWFGFSLITFVFLTSNAEHIFTRLWKSIKIKLRNVTGLEFGVSWMKLVGNFWVATGLIFQLLGEPIINWGSSDIILGILILAPVWIGAIIRKSKHDSLRNS